MEETFRITGDAINVTEIMEKLKQRVKEKREAGLYDKYNLSKASRLGIDEIQSEEEFLEYYLKLIEETADVDISDFEIVSKGGLQGKFIVGVKTIIWKLLKFYTYRLFSQQKEFNAQAVNTIMSLNKKIDKLSEKIDRIENSSQKSVTR